MNLGKNLKNILHAKSTPNFLFALYFNWKNSKDKKKLLESMKNENDLLEMIGTIEQKHWGDRIKLVLDCKDNEAIIKNKLAGQFDGEHLIMHNGIKIDPLSYYSYPVLKMLMKNKGVHEPQEEKIFQEVLLSLSKKTPKTMLELGAYWSFYSMWMMQKFPQTQCYMVEPDRKNLFYGKQNLALNGMRGTFIHAGIGQQKNTNQNITTVDDICKKHRIKFLDILHSDIQGYELEMLYGSQKMLSENRVGYAFISTHSNELHEQCYQLLKEKYGFHLVASANVDESFSWDGILVMKSSSYQGIEEVLISKRIKQEI